MARPIPQNPNRRPSNTVKPVQQRERYNTPSSDNGDFYLLFSFVKLGLFVLGAIAVVIILGALLIQFIQATMPISLISLAIIGIVIWLIIKNS